jgi:hypothetical protein
MSDGREEREEQEKRRELERKEPRRERREDWLDQDPAEVGAPERGGS